MFIKKLQSSVKIHVLWRESVKNILHNWIDSLIILSERANFTFTTKKMRIKIYKIWITRLYISCSMGICWFCAWMCLLLNTWTKGNACDCRHFIMYFVIHILSHHLAANAIIFEWQCIYGQNQCWSIRGFLSCIDHIYTVMLS